MVNAWVYYSGNKKCPRNKVLSYSAPGTNRLPKRDRRGYRAYLSVSGGISVLASALYTRGSTSRSWHKPTPGLYKQVSSDLRNRKAVDPDLRFTRCRRLAHNA